MPSSKVSTRPAAEEVTFEEVTFEEVTLLWGNGRRLRFRVRIRTLASVSPADLPFVLPMSSDENSRLADWLFEPQTMIGLSAVVLSLCGLSISLYEASLIREQQRASVWPNVAVGVSITGERFQFNASNSGVGPARVEATRLTYRSETLDRWRDLIDRVADVPQDSVGVTYSILGARVMPEESQEKIFEVDIDRPAERNVVDSLWQSVQDGDVDIEVCYCSVYDECWQSSMQARVQQLRDPSQSTENPRPVASCDALDRSGI